MENNKVLIKVQMLRWKAGKSCHFVPKIGESKVIIDSLWVLGDCLRTGLPRMCLSHATLSFNLTNHGA